MLAFVVAREAAAKTSQMEVGCKLDQPHVNIGGRVTRWGGTGTESGDGIMLW